MGFFGFRRRMIQHVREQGGMYELYKHFVDIFLEDGFQLREVTNDSLYLHYGTNEGKIGVQIIQCSIEKVEIVFGEAPHSGDFLLPIGQGFGEGEQWGETAVGAR